jgi:hypothetical protein
LVCGAIELEVRRPASHAKLGGSCRYRIVPMAGTPETPQPTLYGPAISNTAQLSPQYGTLSAYFNRRR